MDAPTLAGDVSDHADHDVCRLVRAIGEADDPADRVRRPEQRARQAGAEEDRRDVGRGVARLEVPPGQQRDAHGREIAGRDEAGGRARQEVVGAGLRLPDRDGRDRPRGGFRERQRGHGLRAPNAGERPDPLGQLDVEPRGVAVRPVVAHRQRQLEREQVLRVEPRIDRPQGPEAPQHRRRAHEQRERDGDLEHGFGQEPTGQVAAARPERTLHRHLVAVAPGPDQDEVRRVRAREHENEQRREQQDDQRLPHVLDQSGAQRLDGRPPAAIAEQVRRDARIPLSSRWRSRAAASGVTRA